MKALKDLYLDYYMVLIEVAVISILLGVGFTVGQYLTDWMLG